MSIVSDNYIEAEERAISQAELRLDTLDATIQELQDIKKSVSIVWEPILFKTLGVALGLAELHKKEVKQHIKSKHHNIALTKAIYGAKVF